MDSIKFRNSDLKKSPTTGSVDESPYRFSGSDDGIRNRVENMVLDEDEDDEEEWDSNDTEGSSAVHEIVQRLKMRTGHTGSGRRVYKWVPGSVDAV